MSTSKAPPKADGRRRVGHAKQLRCRSDSSEEASGQPSCALRLLTRPRQSSVCRDNRCARVYCVTLGIGMSSSCSRRSSATQRELHAVRPDLLCQQLAGQTVAVRSRLRLGRTGMASSIRPYRIHWFRGLAPKLRTLDLLLHAMCN